MWWILLPTLSDQPRGYDITVSSRNFVITRFFLWAIIAVLELYLFGVWINRGIIWSSHIVDCKPCGLNFCLLFLVIVAFVVILSAQNLRASLLFKHVLLSLDSVVIKGDRVVPKFPEDHAEAISVHLQRWLLDLLELSKCLWRAPNTCDPIIEEHIAVLHEVKVFEVTDSYFHLKSPTTDLF